MGNTSRGAQSRPHLTLAVSGEQPVHASDQSADLTSIYDFLSHEIEDRLGVGFVEKIPMELLQSYCLATVRQNEPTAALLHELITNFMTAYSNPETNAEALKAFDFLAHLSEKASQK